MKNFKDQSIHASPVSPRLGRALALVLLTMATTACGTYSRNGVTPTGSIAAATVAPPNSTATSSGPSGTSTPTPAQLNIQNPQPNVFTWNASGILNFELDRTPDNGVTRYVYLHVRCASLDKTTCKVYDMNFNKNEVDDISNNVDIGINNGVFTLTDNLYYDGLGAGFNPLIQAL